MTIKDVAKAAGTSPSTVTRVIQNKSTISDETAKRVRKDEGAQPPSQPQCSGLQVAPYSGYRPVAS